MLLRLKPVARSLSARAEFFGLELEGWGFVIAWAIVMRLIGDQIQALQKRQTELEKQLKSSQSELENQRKELERLKKASKEY